MTELIVKQNDILYKAGEIQFPAFENYKRAAEEIAEYIRSVELTEDNTKEVKKVLASARKVADGLSKKRIEIKKTVLSPYNEFERQTKIITAIIAEAESALRTKLNAIEEAERQRKQGEIEALYRKRADMYKIGTLLHDGGFTYFWKPVFANKTTKLTNVEKQIVDFLERTEQDIETLNRMGNEYLAEYLTCLNVTAAISAVENRREMREKVALQEGEQVARFVIKGEQNIKLARLVLKENNIKYQEVE